MYWATWQRAAPSALIASVSPHQRFEAIVREIRIPVICILDTVARASARIGARQVLPLGTAITMRSPRFREEFARHALAAASLPFFF